MTDRYMKEEDVHRLVDTLWQCICTPWFEEYRESFEKMDTEQLGTWVRSQVCHAFDVHEGGNSYLRLKADNFDIIKPPAYMGHLLAAYKALAEDYRYALRLIADSDLSPNAVSNTALRALGAESEDSRKQIGIALEMRANG